MICIENITNNLDSKRIPINSQQRKLKESNPIYPYVGANNILGYIDEFIYDEKIICVAEDGGAWGAMEKCSFIIDEKCWVNNHAHVLTAKDNLHLEYLSYYLNFANLNSHITGSTRGKLNKGRLNKIKIPLPQLKTQKHIAQILDDAAALRDKTKQLLSEYDLLAQSIFLDMFGDPSCGNIYELKVSIEILGGYAFKSVDFVEAGVPLIKIGTVNKGYFDLKNSSFLPIDYLFKYEKWIIKPLDMLMSLTGTVGKNDYGNIEIATDQCDKYFLNQRVAKVDVNQNYNRSFFYYMFLQPQVKRLLTKISRGVRQANISNADILKLKLIRPQIELQNQFAEKIDLIEQQKVLAKQELQESEDLFNCLLQKAFKGELV